MKIAIILSLSLHLTNAFEYKTSDPSMLFPYTQAASYSPAPGFVLNPSMLISTGGFSFCNSISRPYSEKSLTGATIALQYTNTNMGGQLSWNRFGDDVYSEDSFSMSGAISVLKIFTMGLCENFYKLQIQSDEINYNKDFYSTDISFSVQPFAPIRLDFIQTGLMSRFNELEEETIYPEWSAGILLFPERGFSLSWSITDSDAKYINTFSVATVPLPNLVIQGGYSKETSSFAGALSVILKNFSVTYGLKLHSYLGYTHSIGISFSERPMPPSLNYGETASITSQKKQRIDINNSSYEEIINLPGMDEITAKRIILYRDKIGPISTASLYRIGMEGRKISKLKENIYGLEKDVIPERDSYKKKKYTKSRKWKISTETKIKQLFRKIIAKGIAADKALKFSEGAIKRRKSISKELQLDSELTESEKSTIRKICGIR